MTLPALRQLVQTSRRRGVPSTMALTRWILGLNRRELRPLIRRCMAPLPRRLMLLPKLGCLPQISQTAPINGHRHERRGMKKMALLTTSI